MKPLRVRWKVAVPIFGAGLILIYFMLSRFMGKTVY